MEQQQEHKFLVDEEQARSVFEAASRHLEPQDRDPVRPVTYVRTTYFDTADHAYYRSHGTPTSRRLRVREYAAAPSPDAPPLLSGACFLEFKHSTNGLRRKIRVQLHPDEVDANLHALPDWPVGPCVTTWYSRTALADAAQRTRVTIDRGVQFCAPVPIGDPCTGIHPPGLLARGPGLVLEIKLSDCIPDWLARALRGIPEAIGFSKFAAAMRAVEAKGMLSANDNWEWSELSQPAVQ